MLLILQCLDLCSCCNICVKLMIQVQYAFSNSLAGLAVLVKSSVGPIASPSLCGKNKYICIASKNIEQIYIFSVH